MSDLINNFYFIRVLFIVIVVLIGVSVIDTMRKKYSKSLSARFDFKKIDLNFLIRMITLSFVLRILIEQTVCFLPIDKTILNIPMNFWGVVLEIITTCLFAPIFEEVIFRFGLYEYLNKKFKSNIIIMLLTSIIFSAIHFYEIDGFIILLVISLIWNYSYFKTDNLIYPIIMHFIHNIYAVIGYIELNNIVYIVFGIICLITYMLFKIKSSSKNTTAKIRTKI